MHDDPQPQQWPAEDAAAPEPASSAASPAVTPLWRRRPVQLAAAAVLVAAGVGAYVAASSGPAQVHVHGTLQLGPLGSVDTTSTSGAVNGDACESGSGYSDISAGTTVAVGGGNGQTLAVGALSAGVEANVDNSLGSPLGDCVFSFDVAVPGGQSAYTVTISHRGTQTYTPAQVAQGISLTLGQ